MGKYFSEHKAIRFILGGFSVLISIFGCLAIFFALIGVWVALETGDWGAYTRDIIVITGVGLVCAVGGAKSALKFEALGGKG